MGRFIIAFAITVIIYCIFLLIKSENAYKNQMKILEAIDDYSKDSQNHAECIRIMGNMESFDATLWRLWDFGCENILPKADYELIKPYIKEKRK